VNDSPRPPRSLAFAPELSRPIQLLGKDARPFHFAALRGNALLGLILHLAGVPICDEKVSIATFSSCGPRGETPWSKDVLVVPSEVAMLAGETRCSEVFRAVEAGTPVFWSPEVHGLMPDDFKAAVREHIETLATVRPPPTRPAPAPRPPAPTPPPCGPPPANRP